MDDPASVLFSAEQLETLRGQIVEFKRLRPSLHEVADLIALHDHTGEIQGAACRLCNTIVPWLDNSDKNLIRIITKKNSLEFGQTIINYYEEL